MERILSMPVTRAIVQLVQITRTTELVRHSLKIQEISAFHCPHYTALLIHDNHSGNKQRVLQSMREERVTRPEGPNHDLTLLVSTASQAAYTRALFNPSCMPYIKNDGHCSA
jgi:hypothetical protein